MCLTRIRDNSARTGLHASALPAVIIIRYLHSDGERIQSQITQGQSVQDGCGTDLKKHALGASVFGLKSDEDEM